jgi:hypothetical protein
MMTKRDLNVAMEGIDDDEVVVCADQNGGWDNIIGVGEVGGIPAIIFGGGSPFSDERREQEE